jgi:quinol monooxygenase YgiN
MADKKITLIVKIKAKKGMEEAVKKELLSLLPLSRSEPGCIHYDLHQATNDKSVFYFYESWKSQKDLDEHMQKPYLKALHEIAAKLFDGPVDGTYVDIIG